MNLTQSDSAHIPTGRSGQIGPYRVVTSLGVGGMAEVLKVQDNLTGQYRALKIHFSPTHDENILLRYRREQRALARCEHPNVVRAFEYGVHEGRPYMVMEFVEGVPLTRFLEERDLSPGRERDKMACLLGLQLASALDHIHGRHLVHCDLKPENILVTRDEIVKLVDFGIALDLGQAGGMGEGELVGTYAYCSPEQVSGTPLDHRSDLYSFGVVLYLLLTGKLPFIAENAIGFIFRHTSAPPEPPEQYYPDIAPELRALLFSLLEKRTVDRPQSGRDVEQALRAFVEARMREDALPTRHFLPERERDQTSNLRLFEPAFVGRRTEKAQLEGAISLLQAGASGLVLLSGEVGIGKSRLLDEALAEARARGLTLYQGRCLPESDRPYQDLQELVEVIAGSLSTSDILRIQAELEPHLPYLARAFPSTRRLLAAGLPPVAEADPRIELERIREGLQTFLRVVLTGPAILALKDLQWADHATLSLLGALSLEGAGEEQAPILWIGSVAGDELADEHPIQHWLRAPMPLVEVIQVSPLDQEEVDALLYSMLDGHLATPHLSTELRAATRGNPLFIIEMVKELVESRQLRQKRDDGSSTWVLESASPAGPVIPGSIREALAGRLSRLSVPASRLMEYAAVLGRPFSYEWIRMISGLAEDTLLDVIDELLAKRVWVERKGRAHSMFSVHHPVMGENVLERIEPLKRTQLHRLVAEAWMQVHGAEDPASVGLLATHLFQGGRYDVAASFLLRAAEGRLALGLYQSALRLLEQGSECCRQVPTLEPRLKGLIHLRLGAVLLYLGQAEKTIGALRVAFHEAQAQGHLEIQGQAVFQLARLASRQGDYVTSVRQFADAMRMQRECQDQVGMLRSLQGLAVGFWFLGDLGRSRKLFEESLVGARKLGDLVLIAQGLNGQGLAFLLEGRFADAIRSFGEAADVSRAGGRDIFYLLCQLNEADALRQTGQLGAARALVSSLGPQLERLLDKELLASAANLRAAIALELRELEVVEKELVLCGELLQSAPQHYTRAYRQLLVGQLELSRGRPVEAQLGISEAMTLAEGRQYRELLTRCLRYMALSLIQSGSTSEGIALLHRAQAEAERLHNHFGAAEARLFLAEALLVTGARTEALAQLEQILPELTRMDLRLHRIRAHTLWARILQEEKDLAKAAAVLEPAVHLVREIRSLLSPEERQSFDTRPELRGLGLLWRSLSSGAAG